MKVQCKSCGHTKFVKNLDIIQVCSKCEHVDQFIEVPMGVADLVQDKYNAIESNMLKHAKWQEDKITELAEKLRSLDIAKNSITMQYELIINRLEQSEEDAQNYAVKCKAESGELMEKLNEERIINSELLATNTRLVISETDKHDRLMTAIEALEWYADGNFCDGDMAKCILEELK